MTERYPLRNRRKEKNRWALMSAAFDLFAEKGFDATKLEEIAERADLHVQTLFRHFTSKTDLATALDKEHLERFRRLYADRTSDTFTFWHGWVAEYSDHIAHTRGDRYRKALRTFYQLPSVSIAFLDIWHGYEETLAEGLAKDFGMDVKKDALPSLVACMLWGGNMLVARRWAFSNRSKEGLKEDALRVVDEAAAVFGKNIVKRPKADRSRE
jgi:AcrR family transcriptional regulator